MRRDADARHALHPAAAGARQPVSRRRFPAELSAAQAAGPDVCARSSRSSTSSASLPAASCIGCSSHDRLNEPTLMQWDAWGNRIDRIEVTPLWQRAAQIAAQQRADRDPVRAHARPLFAHPSVRRRLSVSSLVGCLHLSAGDDRRRGAHAARCRAIAQLIERAVPRLTSRDPAQAWTSGQWMTESTGGSDVGASLTRAERDEHGHGACTARSGSRRPSRRRWR